MDMTDTIIPKSDQLNAEDLLTGPRTVTITEVRTGSAEQPVDIVTAEFGPGRPFKPSKTVRRILVAAWGKQAAAYVGRRLTIYRDANVKWGGQAIGGIRVSHMSHIDKPLTIALTETRGKRFSWVIQPLTDESAPATTAPKQTPELAKLAALFEQAGIARPQRLAFVAEVVGRTVNAPGDLTDDEVAAVVAELQLRAEGPE